jgi:RNA polymerase sigma-70 factor, ECF subfamily
VEEDLKLVQEVLKGNIDSFSIIVNKYEITILKFIYNILKDKEASEDIAQEVFITVYNKLYTFNKDYKFSNWLFQIARNKCIDYIRKYKRVYEANVENLSVASTEISPEESLAYTETKMNVEKFVNNLNEVDKHILILKYSDDCKTFRDVAEILSMSESSVKRRYYKSRERFKEYLIVNEMGCR